MDSSSVSTGPRIARNHLLGHIQLLRRSVDVWIEDIQRPLNGPVLYEYSASQQGQLIGIYFGLARQGIGRPLEQYGPVLEALHANRGKHKFGDPTTPWPYKKHDPWGFRWVHHQLESLLLKPEVEIVLAVRVLSPPTTLTQKPEPGLQPQDAGEVTSDDAADEASSLTAAERAMINAWKNDPRCWNEKTMKSVQAGTKPGGPLDPVW